MALGAVVAGLLGLTLGILTRLGPFAAVLGVGLAVLAVWVSYWESDRIVIASTGARPADPATHRQYHNLVEGLSLAAGLPMPRLYVVDSPALNAFATGRDPDHAAIAVTTGLLAELDRYELEGVLSHELAHVRNLDIRTMTVVAVVAGAIVILADWTLRSLWFGGHRRDRSRGDGAFPVLAVVGVLAAVLAPLAAQLVRASVSRQREYLADASGVLLTRYPTGLANALRKIGQDTRPLRHDNAATAHLWIKNPLEGRPSRSGRTSWQMFATHPPIADRIARLEAMGAPT